MKNGRLMEPFSSLIQSNSCRTFNFLAKSSSNSLASIIQSFIDSGSPFKGQTIHAQVVKSGFPSNTNIAIKLLILHIRCHSLINARATFDKMPRPTLSAYNYMIGGYFKEGLAKESLELFQKLTFSNLKPDGFTLSMTLKLSASLVSVNYARQMHCHIIKLNFDSDDVVVAALIDSYVKNGKISYARSVYDGILEPNVVCSTSLIVGYMNQGQLVQAEQIFENMIERDEVVFNAMIEGYSKTLETAASSLQMYKGMQHVGLQPTISTYVSVIGACSLLSALEFGEQVQAQIMKTELYSHVKTGSALIDMYSKCGQVEDARRIFNYMPERNVISWTSMIDGYGKNGIPHGAIELFYEMKNNQIVRPNYATILSVLSACGHAGLVSTGKEVFESMEKDFLLKPLMEHYACMVDLLGRSGNLDEAYKFVRQIPEKPNSDVWTALLGASRLHGNLEMADIAAKNVFELSKCGRPGAYVALSNTLAAAKKWQGVSEVREVMHERRVSKDSARSWIGTE